MRLSCTPFTVVGVVCAVVLLLCEIPRVASHNSNVRGGIFGGSIEDDNNDDDDDDDFRCHTRAPTLQDTNAIKAAVRAYQNRISTAREVADEIITVPVCFFVITDTNGANNRTDEQLQGQLDHMNVAFSASSCCDTSLDWCEPGRCSADTGIRFAWQQLDENENAIKGATVGNLTDPGACVFRVENHFWATLGIYELRMKRKLHKGGADVLNVYWFNLGNSGLSGRSSSPPRLMHPWIIQQDGVIASYRRMTGGEASSNEGDLAVHEIGHWLGLHHTFQGGCLRSDAIFDTAPERFPFRGCGSRRRTPIGRDSCPLIDDKPDPFNNFMDYSNDECSFEFTPGQAVVMRAAYTIIRLGNEENRVLDAIPLTSGEPSPVPILAPRQAQIFAMNATSTVSCRTSSEVRHSLYLNWDSEPRLRRLRDDCVSKSLVRTNEKCKARYRGEGGKILFAAVEAGRYNSLQNATITCTEQG